MSRPTTTIPRSVVLMADTNQRDDMAAMLATLGYQDSGCSTIEDMRRLASIIISDVAIVAVDFVEAAQLTELAQVMETKRFLAPLVVIAPDLKPLTHVKELAMVCGCAQFPLEVDELEVLVCVVTHQFRVKRNLLERVASTKLVARAVGVLLERCRELHTYNEAYRYLQQLASSNNRSKKSQAQRVLRADEEMTITVSARRRERRGQKQSGE